MSVTAAPSKMPGAVLGLRKKAKKPLSDNGCLLTKKQLSQKLPMPERTIEKLQATGIIPALKITPRLVRYELSAVLEGLRRYQTATLK